MTNRLKYLSFFFSSFLFLFSGGFLNAENPANLDLIDTPTAETLMRGNFSFIFTGYNHGGILNKGLVGLHDQFYLGVSFDVERAIGQEEPKFNIPGAIAKFKVTDGSEAFPFKFAFGYDSFYAGVPGKTNNNQNPYARTLYGPYAVFSRPVWMFEQEQFFNIGFRMPMQPQYRPNDVTMFIGFEIPIGNFYILTELERIYFDKDKLDSVLFNLGLRYVAFEKIALELNFMMGYDVTTNRMLVVEYVDSF
jgi:hypothetical protein